MVMTFLVQGQPTWSTKFIPGEPGTHRATLY